MKIKKCISIVLSILVILFLVICYFGKNSNDIYKLSDSSVTKIIINRVEGYYTVTDREDITKIIGFFRTMKLRRAFQHNKDGMIATLDIYAEDTDDNCSILLLENDITINHKNYKPLRNYSEELIEMFENFERKYSVNKN